MEVFATRGQRHRLGRKEEGEVHWVACTEGGRGEGVDIVI